MNPWQSLQDDIGAFTDKTFPHATARSKALHLAEEAKEAAAEPSNLMEWADCMILLLDGARKAGFTVEDLHRGVLEKMEINKKRRWGAPDKDGVVRHTS